MAEDTSKWSASFESPPLSAAQIDAFQRRIDAICGKSREKSINRIVWGGNAVKRIACEWNSSGEPVRYKDIARYKIRRNNPNTDEIIEIPMRRYVMETRIEPEQNGYEQSREIRFVDSEGKNKHDFDVPKGHYEFWYILADHTACEQYCEEERICLGEYRPPLERDLIHLRKITEQIKIDNERIGILIDPFSPISEQMQAQLIAAENRKLAEENQKRQAELACHARDWMRTHGHRITSDDPSVLKHGKFHFVGKAAEKTEKTQ